MTAVSTVVDHSRGLYRLWQEDWFESGDAPANPEFDRLFDVLWGVAPDFTRTGDSAYETHRYTPRMPEWDAKVSEVLKEAQ